MSRTLQSLNQSLPESLLDLAHMHVGRFMKPQRSLPELGIWEWPYRLEISNGRVEFNQQQCMDLQKEVNSREAETILEFGERRFREFMAGESFTAASINALETEIHLRLGEWLKLQERANSSGDSAEESVKTWIECGLEWSAKVIYCLSEESALRARGKETYTHAYQRGLLSWQRIRTL